MANCTRSSEDAYGAMSVLVDGVAGLVIVDTSTLTPFLTSFTFPNVTRSDNGAVFTCVAPPSSTVIASLTLTVLCE